MLRLEDNPCVRRQVLSTEQHHWWWHPPENPHCPVWRISFPPGTVCGNSTPPSLPTPPHCPCFSKDTHHSPHTLPLLASVHSLCPVWERLRHFRSHGLQPVFNSLWLPRVKFWLKYPSLAVPFPQNKSLQSCISHRLSLACLRSVSWHGNTVALVHFVKD